MDIFKKLQKTFENGQTPDPSEFKGVYRVHLVTGFLPELRFFGHIKFFPEKVELMGGGYNRFWGNIRIGDFMVTKTESVLGDGQKVLKIDYNRPGNPFWLKILNDELKRIRPDYYLGRGVLSLFGKAFNSFYFSVSK